MRSNVSFSDVEAFVAVAQHLSFRAAAQSLNVSPSALSRRIAKLESSLNASLLVRTTRKVQLTIAGKQFLARAQELMTGIDELLIKGFEDSRPYSRVTIACTNSYSQVFMPAAVARFARIHPKTPVRIIGASAVEVLESVRNGDADFAVTDMGLQETGLEFVPLGGERVVLGMPYGHPFSKLKHVEWESLSSERFISLWPGSPFRALLDSELARAGKSVSYFYEVHNLHTAISFVAAGLGVTAVTEQMIPSGSKLIATVPLRNPVISRHRALVRVSDRKMRSIAQEFWDMFLSDWSEIVDARVHPFLS